VPIFVINRLLAVKRGVWVNFIGIRSLSTLG
jgi:hypothetical protein